MKLQCVPDSKVRAANMGTIWGREDPGGPHVGPMNYATWGLFWDLNHKLMEISKGIYASKMLVLHFLCMTNIIADTSIKYKRFVIVND